MLRKHPSSWGSVTLGEFCFVFCFFFDDGGTKRFAPNDL